MYLDLGVEAKRDFLANINSNNYCQGRFCQWPLGGPWGAEKDFELEHKNGLFSSQIQEVGSWPIGERVWLVYRNEGSSLTFSKLLFIYLFLFF